MALFVAEPGRQQAFALAVRGLSGWATARADGAARLNAILETVADGNIPGAILPRRAGDRMVYYGLADTPAAWRALRPLLQAYAGVTLSDFSGRQVQLDPADSFEAVLAEYGFDLAARFSAYGDRQRETALVNALVQLRKTLARADRPVRELPRTTSQVLREFRMALVTGDRKGAAGGLSFLRDNMRLDALNLAFLDVQLDTAFGEWERVLAATAFVSICRTRRPPAVTVALAEAVFRVRIVPFIDAADAQGAVAAFRDTADGYGELFAVLPPALSASAGLAFLVAAVAAQPSNVARLDPLRSQSGSWLEAERRFADALLGLATATAPAVPSAPQLLPPERWLDLASAPGPASAQRAQAILLAAAQLQTLDGYRVAVAYIDALPDDVRTAALAVPGLREMWQGIVRFTAGGRVPASWTEWARLLPELAFAEARGWAERAVHEWPIERQLRSAADVNELVASMTAAANAVEERVADALPHLVSWVQADPVWPNPAYRALYETLAELLLLTAGGSTATPRALNTMLDALLALGTDTSGYRRLLGDLRDAVPSFGGLRNVDALIDLAELMVIHPSPDQGARTGLWGAVLAELQPLGPRLGAGQRVLLRELARVLGLADLVASFEPAESADEERGVSTGVSAAGKVVGIYTLTESVVGRVRQAATAQYPGLVVQFAHDRVAGERLLALARGADLFILAWSSAKHAAGDVIKRARSPGRPLRYAAGGGSSSILREIQDYIATSGT